MSGAKLILKNPRNGSIKTAPIGFSWTILFFGFLVPLYRKEWFWTILTLILQVITLGVAAIPLAFCYNKIYIRRLINKGYTYFSRSGNISPEKMDKYLHLQKKVFEKAFAPRF